MTPFAEAGSRPEPLSRITIGALEDIGYGVDYDAAVEFTIDDLGTCSDTNCPEADDTTSSPLPIYEPTEAEVTAIMEGVKDDLIYFHEYLHQRDDCEQGPIEVECDGFSGVEEMDVLYVGQDGLQHSYSVTYDDVKDM